MSTEFRATKILISLVIILTLPCINACSVVMFNTMGTNYEEQINKNSTKGKINELLGQPVSSVMYSKHIYAGHRNVTKYCKYRSPSYWVYRENPKGKEIAGYEIYRIKGVVKNIEKIDKAHFALNMDFLTLGLTEIPFTIWAIVYWAHNARAEKDMTIWYGTDNKFEGGEIRLSKTKKLVTNIYAWCPRKTIQQPER